MIHFDRKFNWRDFVNVIAAICVALGCLLIMITWWHINSDVAFPIASLAAGAAYALGKLTECLNE
ncbi:hypothetical protein EVC12_097 [Rhizobium phage RHph_I42]|nr:hypothetical protein EVC12_097 [Rhizobium phage RHph_I42]